MTRPTKFTIIIILLITFVCPTYSYAKLFNKKNKQQEVDIHQLTFEENIVTPELGKQTNTIVRFQDEQAKSIEIISSIRTPYEVEKTRNNEVLMITIPAHCLFEANDTILTENGKTALKPFLKYLETSGLYKMVLAMHSDNTGNDTYTYNITTGRVNSVYKWFTDNTSTNFVVKYPFGSNAPIVDNNSISNRTKNRRLVIYLIPDKTMISQAKRGKITL